MKIIDLDKESLQSIGKGPFGNIYNSFKGMPQEAFWFLINHQEGDLVGVFSRNDIGDVDLVWGDDSCGVCHILLRHISEKDFPTIDQMILAITDIVQNGNSERESPDVMVIRKGIYVVIVRKNYRINGKKPEPKNWILTAYSKESSNVTLAPPDND